MTVFYQESFRWFLQELSDFSPNYVHYALDNNAYQ